MLTQRICFNLWLRLLYRGVSSAAEETMLCGIVFQRKVVCSHSSSLDGKKKAIEINRHRFIIPTRLGGS